MDGQSGVTESFWMATAEVPVFEQMSRNIDTVDACIVGAGISGLTTAYLLLKAGKSVVVLDDGPVAAGETERTTAHLTNVIDDRYFEIERMHGRENARLAAESQTSAVNKIEQIVTEEGIDCDFKRIDGYLFLGESDDIKTLEKELETVEELGFVGVSMVPRLPFGLDRPALKFSRQGQFHVLKYVIGLCNAIKSMGGSIFCFEHVSKIEDGDTVVVHTKTGHTVKARNVVIATNSPITDRVKVHTKQAPYRTFAIGATVPAGSVETALYWDTEEPYHYMRLQPTYTPKLEMLILGGEDHRTGEENDGEERFARLERWMRINVPQAGEVEYQWSGQVYEPEDGLGFIGPDPAHGKNVFITTGDSGMGMTHGTMSGIILTDLICGRDNAWAKLYDPSRKPFEYLKENLNTVAQYAKKLAPSEVDSPDDIEPGEGAIIRRGLKQVAVYKDLDGNILELSATCPHLGATVCWNSCEKSWDCPAHGSRFSACGEVIDGPANGDLKPVHDEEHRKAG